MNEQITTRRAIEVCLSRLPMQDGTRRDLVHALLRAIKGEPDQRAHDPACLIAAAHLAIGELSGVDPSFGKAALISRMQEARRHLIDGLKPPQASAPEWIGPGESPHRYSPDIMAQGDCRVCGHTWQAHKETGAL